MHNSFIKSWSTWKEESVLQKLLPIWWISFIITVTVHWLCPPHLLPKGCPTSTTSLSRFTTVVLFALRNSSSLLLRSAFSASNCGKMQNYWTGIQLNFVAVLLYVDKDILNCCHKKIFKFNKSNHLWPQTQSYNCDKFNRMTIIICSLVVFNTNQYLFNSWFQLCFIDFVVSVISWGPFGSHLVVIHCPFSLHEILWRKYITEYYFLW